MSTATTRRADRADQHRAESELADLRARYLRQLVRGDSALASRLRRRAIWLARRLVGRYRSADLWVMLGDVYVSSQKSEACYRRAVSLDPACSEARFELAKIKYYVRRDYCAAEKLVDQLVDRLPHGLETEVLGLAELVYRTCNRPQDAARARRRRSRWVKRLPAGTVEEIDPDWNKPDPASRAVRMPNGAVRRSTGRRR